MIRKGPLGPSLCWLHTVVTEQDFVAGFYAQMTALMLHHELQWPVLPGVSMTWMRDPRINDDDEMPVDGGVHVTLDDGSYAGDVRSGLPITNQQAVERIFSGNGHRSGSHVLDACAVYKLYSPQCVERQSLYIYSKILPCTSRLQGASMC